MVQNKKRRGIITVLASQEHRASLSAFAASVPDWLPVPIVLGMMHTDQQDEALLERLRYGCPLPIHEVVQPTTLEPGHIYTDLSGGGLCVRGGQVFAAPIRSTTGTVLVSSAVAEHGGYTIAILLGGTLEDAAADAHKVVWAGGAVFAHQVGGERGALIRNGVARGYKSAENLAEALGVVCSGLQRAVS